VHGDGDGWVTCDLGHRHWGLNGAAGLLITDIGRARIVLQHRAERTHEGGTWGLPGGARDSHEDAVGTALREAGEEAGVDPATVAPLGRSTDDHGGWSYTTVVARAVAPVHPHAANWESSEVRWCDVAEVARLPLHPGFAHSWPALQTIPRPVRVVVDMANVVGARPDGWWRDRLGANAALRERIVGLSRRGLDAAALPDGVPPGSLTHTFPDWVLVVEGQASALTPPAPTEWWERQTRVVAAAGSGDDEIVAQADGAVAAGRTVVVVTADRGLRTRLGAAATVGPNWLLGQLDAG
jgi:8-oxo-dGTP diphosphatase